MINLNFQLYVEKSVHCISIRLRSANGRFSENFWPQGNIFGYMETHRYTNSFAIIYQRGRGNSESLFRASLFNYTRWLISSSDDLLTKKKKKKYSCTQDGRVNGNSTVHNTCKASYEISHNIGPS